MPDHELPTESLTAGDCYRLMSSLIIPRPIAWVSTLSAEGHPNLAPFSYFQGMCSDPPTVVLGIAWLADGKPKDTLRNILDTGEFTISQVSEALAEKMNLTAGSYPAHTDEWQLAGLDSAPSRAVAPPRVARALAAFECRLVHAIPLGEGSTGAPSATMVVGHIVHFHVREGLIEYGPGDKLRQVDSAQLAAVGRLGGMAYTRTRDRFELARPKIT